MANDLHEWGVSKMKALIPNQLQDPVFRFCLLDKTEDIKTGKSPRVVDAWQTGTSLSDLERRMNEVPNAATNRVGVIAGFGNLVIVDADRKGDDFAAICSVMESLVQTCTVNTVSDGRHYYLRVKDLPFNTKVLSNRNGEIRARNAQVVCAGSELCGKKYVVVKDLPIAEVTADALMTALEPFLKHENTEEQTNNDEPRTPHDIQSVLNNKRDYKLRALLSGDESGYASTSEAEIALVQKLIFYGLNKEQIFDILENHSKLDKWKTAPQAYKEMTYTKAVQFRQETKEEKPNADAPIAESGKIETVDLPNFLETKHLREFDALDLSLTLRGSDYKKITKHLWYALVAEQIKEHEIYLGEYTHDSRIHLCFVFDSGQGKGEYKRVIKKIYNAFGKTIDEQIISHEQQLVGTVEVEMMKNPETHKRERVVFENKGALANDSLIFDEAHTVLTSSKDTHVAVREQLRKAMDKIGLNEIVKRTTKIRHEEKLKYFSPTTLYLLTQPKPLYPDFCGDGTFRRFIFPYVRFPETNQLASVFDKMTTKTRDEKNINRFIAFLRTVKKPVKTIEFSAGAIEAAMECLTDLQRRAKNTPLKIRDFACSLLHHYTLVIARYSVVLAASQNSETVESYHVYLAYMDALDGIMRGFDYVNTKTIGELDSGGKWHGARGRDQEILRWLADQDAFDEKSGVPSGLVSEQIRGVFAVEERAARDVLAKHKSRGWVVQKHRKDTWVCWLGFKPDFGTGGTGGTGSGATTENFKDIEAFVQKNYPVLLETMNTPQKFRRDTTATTADTADTDETAPKPSYMGGIFEGRSAGTNASTEKPAQKPVFRPCEVCGAESVSHIQDRRVCGSCLGRENSSFEVVQ